MTDKITQDARVYTDVQGLEQLRYQSKSDPKAATKEVAKQFESILMQMVMHSMRDANKAFTSDVLNNEQMDFYQDIFDKQLSLVLSGRGVGFAEVIEKNLDPQAATAAVSSPTEKATQTPFIAPAMPKPVPLQNPPIEIKEKMTFNSPEEFVKKLWPLAKVAAKAIGASPQLLLAQAALETNWGKKILPHGQDTSTFNLFNIKADSSWSKKSARLDSIEQKNGVLVKEKSHFRSYDSYKESFMDYVHFLKQNARYADALNKAPNPKQFAHALQDAGFATDTNYANKILKIYEKIAEKI